MAKIDLVVYTRGLYRGFKACSGSFSVTTAISAKAKTRLNSKETECMTLIYFRLNSADPSTFTLDGIMMKKIYFM